MQGPRQHLRLSAKSAMRQFAKVVSACFSRALEQEKHCAKVSVVSAHGCPYLSDCIRIPDISPMNRNAFDWTGLNSARGKADYLVKGKGVSVHSQEH